VLRGETATVRRTRRGKNTEQLRMVTDIGGGAYITVAEIGIDLDPFANGKTQSTRYQDLHLTLNDGDVDTLDISCSCKLPLHLFVLLVNEQDLGHNRYDPNTVGIDEITSERMICFYHRKRPEDDPRRNVAVIHGERRDRIVAAAETTTGGVAAPLSTFPLRRGAACPVARCTQVASSRASKTKT